MYQKQFHTDRKSIEIKSFGIIAYTILMNLLDISEIEIFGLIYHSQTVQFIVKCQ